MFVFFLLLLIFCVFEEQNMASSDDYDVIGTHEVIDGCPQSGPWTGDRDTITLIMSMFYKKQGHHHNGDQAARRSHKLCSICVWLQFERATFLPPFWRLRGMCSVVDGPTR